MPNPLEQTSPYCPGVRVLQINEISVYILDQEKNFRSPIQVYF